LHDSIGDSAISAKKLCRGRGGQVERGSIEVGVLLPDHARVDVLEELVEAKLADALGRVADGGGGPPEQQPPGPGLLHRQLEPIAQRLVLLLVDLQPALDQVEGRDGGVGDAAGESSAHRAQSVVLGGPELAGVLISGSNKRPRGLLICLDRLDGVSEEASKTVHVWGRG